MTGHRRFFATTAATVAIAISLPLNAQKLNGKLIERAIPSSGEKIPIVGLAFSNHPSCADHAALKDVVKTFADNGGRYFDMTLGNAANQQFHINAANELGVSKKMFWSTTAFTPGPSSSPAGVKSQIDSVLARTKASRVDVAWITATGDPLVLAALKEEKKAGRVHHIGVMTIAVSYQNAQILGLMRNEPIDFIGVDYDVSNRFVEAEILPLAMERKIGVVAYFPLGNNFGASCGGGGNLFARVGSAPLPAWAADFDAKTWGQFFVKYVISHPAVTTARVGTSKSQHMLDDMQGGVGRLPNEATRKRMAALIDSFPKPMPPKPPVNPAAAPGIALPVAILDRYAATEWKMASGAAVTFRREGTTLFVKPGTNPEAPLNARTETRLQDPRGPVFEFQVDAEGKVTGLILEQGTPVQRVVLTRN